MRLADQSDGLKVLSEYETQLIARAVGGMVIVEKQTKAPASAVRAGLNSYLQNRFRQVRLHGCGSSFDGGTTLASGSTRVRTRF